MLKVKYTRPMSPSRARLAAGRKVCRKYRNAYIRKLQQKEYEKLRTMVPALAAKQTANKISKVRVIEETIRYIDHLHQALAAKVRSESAAVTSSNAALKLNEESIRTAAHSAFLEAATSGTLPKDNNLLQSASTTTLSAAGTNTCDSSSFITQPKNPVVVMSSSNDEVRTSANTTSSVAVNTSSSGQSVPSLRVSSMTSMLVCENEREVPSYVIQSDAVLRHRASYET